MKLIPLTDKSTSLLYLCLNLVSYIILLYLLVSIATNGFPNIDLDVICMSYSINGYIYMYITRLLFKITPSNSLFNLQIQVHFQIFILKINGSWSNLENSNYILIDQVYIVYSWVWSFKGELLTYDIMSKFLNEVKGWWEF